MANRDPAGGAGPGQTSRAMALRRSSAPDDPVGWLAGHGWAAQVTDARQVLGEHGRAAPTRPGQPAHPGQPALSRQPTLPADQGHGPPGRRPRALLVSAVRDASLARPARRRR